MEYNQKIQHILEKGKCCQKHLVYPGPQGPAGPAGPGSTMGGLQLQLVSEIVPQVDVNAPILFNTTLNQPTSDLIYNPATGEITFQKNGTYFISWWLVVDGTAGTSKISISFTNGTNTIPSVSPLVTGQLSGSALITVTSAPEQWSLRNTSTSLIVLGTTSVHANLTIVELQ